MLHKVEDRRRLAKKIQTHLSECPEVRPFPAAVTRLATACQDPNVNSRQMEAIVECDPALSVKVLRLANSPLFSPSAEVKSVAHAVSLLGMRRLKSVAMSVAGETMFASGDNSATERLQLWQHSLGCAVSARSLAQHAGLDPDNAFLAGVFHDVGKLLFYDVIPEEYAGIVSGASNEALVEEEQSMLGTTHEEVGRLSAQRWNLPEEIKTAVGWHHRPAEASACAEYATLIGLADRLAKFWGLGSDQRPEAELETEIEAQYGISPVDLEALASETQESFQDLAALSAT